MSDFPAVNTLSDSFMINKNLCVNTPPPPSATLEASPGRRGALLHQALRGDGLP